MTDLAETASAIKEACGKAAAAFQDLAPALEQLNKDLLESIGPIPDPTPAPPTPAPSIWVAQGH